MVYLSQDGTIGFEPWPCRERGDLKTLQYDTYNCHLRTKWVANSSEPFSNLKQLGNAGAASLNKDVL